MICKRCHHEHLSDTRCGRLNTPQLSCECPAPILVRGERGFHAYGIPFKDSYGAELEVYESSSAEGPHVWLSVEGLTAPGHANAGNPPGTAHAHMNEEQARALVARLQAWLQEIPSRWNQVHHDA